MAMAANIRHDFRFFRQYRNSGRHFASNRTSLINPLIQTRDINYVGKSTMNASTLSAFQAASKEPKKILITGGTDGIGREATLVFVSLGHDVTIAGRSREKAQLVNDICTSNYQRKVKFHKVDLSSVKETKDFAKTVAAENYDICILNAGVSNPKQATTVDGNEMTMMTNLVSAHMVVQKILENRPKNHNIHFVFVTSILIRIFSTSFFKNRVFDPSKTESWEKAMITGEESGSDKYAISKIGQAAMAVGINRRNIEGVTATSIHPGVVLTNLMDSLPSRQRFYLRLCKPFITSKEEAGINMVRAALFPLELKKYYSTKNEKCLPDLIHSEPTISAFLAFANKYN